MKPADYRPLDDDDEPRAPRAQRWLRLGALLLLSGLPLVALVGVLRGLGSTAGPPARQVARVAILPDTPPPPPPPPERRPEAPRKEPEVLPMPRPQDPPQAPPAEAPIRMEGQAGNGPSAFAAGPVVNDYSGGAPKVGGAAASATVADRAGERLYANTVKQAIQQEIDRQLDAAAGEIEASFAIWIGSDGRIQRWLVEPGGTARKEAALHQALERGVVGLRLPPPPPAAAQPMRFRLTVRAAG